MTFSNPMEKKAAPLNQYILDELVWTLGNSVAGDHAIPHEGTNGEPADALSEKAPCWPSVDSVRLGLLSKRGGSARRM